MRVTSANTRSAIATISEIKAPVPGERQILVDVTAAGINFPDTLVVSGQYQILPERPFVPGKEIAGIVRAVGAGVSGFARGDRVLAQLEHGGRRKDRHLCLADTVTSNAVTI